MTLYVITNDGDCDYMMAFKTRRAAVKSMVQEWEEWYGAYDHPEIKEITDEMKKREADGAVYAYVSDEIGWSKTVWEIRKLSVN